MQKKDMDLIPFLSVNPLLISGGKQGVIGVFIS